MKKLNLIALIIAFTLISTLAFAASPATKESARELLELTGSGKLGVQVMNNMLPAFKEMLPDVPEQFWVDVMSDVDPDELIEMVIPIYQKYLSEEDLKATIAFYQTPTGQKMVNSLPQIMHESMLAGQQWGEQLGNKIVKKYEQEGILTNQ